MRAFDCAYSTLRRQTVFAVILFSSFVPTVSAQQSVSGVSLPLTKCLLGSSERGPQPKPTECNLSTVAALASAGDPYEQNQLGITSALGLGPGRTISHARKWFEKATR